MLRPFHGFALITIGIAAACASIPVGNPALSVPAMAETTPVGTANEDAADDPAIWRNNEDPARSLIVGTDKKGGLYVYDLEGKELSFLPAAGLNNVDLIELADGRVLVAASDRSEPEIARIHLSFLDPATARLKPAGRVEVGRGEGYGICIGETRDDGAVSIYSAPKNGIIYRTMVNPNALGGESDTSEVARVPSQPEGCAFDERTGTLYIGEEAAGIWAIDPESGVKKLVAATGTGLIVPDVEGLALAPEGEEGGYLVASSQGDNAFAVYSLPTMSPLGRFRIAGGALGSVEETDGIEIDNRSFGPAFPDGLFIAQDGVNPPSAQNFKLVSWGEIVATLEEAQRGK